MRSLKVLFEQSQFGISSPATQSSRRRRRVHPFTFAINSSTFSSYPPSIDLRSSWPAASRLFVQILSSSSLFALMRGRERTMVEMSGLLGTSSVCTSFYSCRAGWVRNFYWAIGNPGCSCIVYQPDLLRRWYFFPVTNRQRRSGADGAKERNVLHFPRAPRGRPTSPCPPLIKEAFISFLPEKTDTS